MEAKTEKVVAMGRNPRNRTTKWTDHDTPKASEGDLRCVSVLTPTSKYGILTFPSGAAIVPNVSTTWHVCDKVITGTFTGSGNVFADPKLSMTRWSSSLSDDWVAIGRDMRKACFAALKHEK